MNKQEYIWQEVIETYDRWQFFDVITPLFFNALAALLKMERMERAMFTSKVDNITYKFAIRKQYGSLYYTLLKDGSLNVSQEFIQKHPHRCVPKQQSLED